MSKTLHRLYLSLIAWTFSLLSASATPAPGQLKGVSHAASLAKPVDGQILRLATTDMLFNETFDKQWEEGEALFTWDQGLLLQIVCHTCYITGTVSGSYTPGAGINITGLEDDVMQSIDNFLEPVGDDLLDGNFSVFRTMDYSAVNLSNITRDFDYQLQFQLQDLELYMELETTLPSNSTYTLNLWTLPASALSLRAPKSDLSIGAFFTVDLILSSQTEINITSGVHIHIDSAAINVGMFDGNVSGVTLDAGTFEFLNVTVDAGDFELTGSLRVGMHAAAGFELSKFDLSLSGGLGAALYANIAEFTATGTANNDSSKEKCDVALVEGFTMALGAQAGATVVFDSSTWGPVAATETPIWYTELTTACATLRSSSPPTMTSSSSPAAAITARQADGSDDASITTTETTYSIVSCISPGLMNCPVSDQTTLSYATILTTTLAAQTSIISTKSFGTNKQDFTSTSGPLKSYSPPPPSATSTGGGVGANGGGGRGGRVGGKDEKPLIIGMSVGLGVPALAVVAGAIFCLVHRRIKSHRRPTRKSKTGSGQVEETTATTATPGLVPEEQGFLQKTPTVVST